MTIWVLLVCLLVEATYAALLAVGWRRICRTRPPGPGAPSSFSVIVAARNEQERLAPLLDALGRQRDPESEFIVVDDRSEDLTPRLVEERARVDARFRLLEAAESDGPRKKSALAFGIAAARHALLALTDADCVPPPTWLDRLSDWHAAFPGSVLVGYGPFAKRPGPLNRAVRYETLRTALLTAAAVGLDRPYMAVGRNLSYPRQVFDRVEGFAHSRASLSGDDDLFVQEVSARRVAPVRYLLDQGTFVQSEAPATWSAWMAQKARHASAGRFYGRSIQIHLGLWHAAGLALWLGPILAGWPGLMLLLVHLMGQWTLLLPTARRLGETDLLRWFPLLEAQYVAFLWALTLRGLRRIPRRWAGREGGG